MKHVILSLVLAFALAIGFVPSVEATTLQVDCAAGPYFTVAQALAAPAVPGDVIVVHECLAGYNAGFTVSGKDDLQIVAAEAIAGGLVGAFEGGEGTTHPPSPLFFDNNATCVTIEASTNISIVGLLFDGCAGDGFYIRNSRGIHIAGNSVYNVTGDSVSVQGSRNVDLIGNYLYGAYLPGRAGISTDSNSLRIEIKYNVVNFNDTGIVMKAERTNVVNNEVRWNQRLGVGVYSPTSTVSRNVVTNNGSGTAAEQIDFAAPPLLTCVVGNDTGGLGVPSIPGACKAENL